MADEIILDGDIIDLSGIGVKADGVIEHIQRIEAAIQKINSNPISLGSVNGMKELRDATDQLTKATQVLVDAVNKVGTARRSTSQAETTAVKTANDSAVATKKQSDALTDLSNKHKEAERNAKNLAVEYGALDERTQAAARSAAELKAQLAAANSVVKNVGNPNIPLQVNEGRAGSNVDEINAERAAAEKSIETVNELDRAQAEASNSATAMGAAQGEATAGIEEEATAAAETIGVMDEYTGTIRQNIIAQLENNEVLAANAAEQKEIQVAIKQSGAATQQQITRLAELKEQSLLLNETNRNLSITIKNQAKEYLSVDRSVDQLRARVNLLQGSYEKLSFIEKASPFGRAIQQQLDTLEPALRVAESGIGKNQRAVGGYSNAITKAFSGAFGYLRTAANIIPGLGISGIILALVDPMINFAKSLFNTGTEIDIVKGKTKEFIEEEKNLLAVTKDLTDAYNTYNGVLSKGSSTQIQVLKDQLSLLESTGVNAEKTFALKQKIAALEAEDAKKVNATDTELARREQLAHVDALNKEIASLEQKNTGFNKGSAVGTAAEARAAQLRIELDLTKKAATEGNLIDASREYHKRNYINLNNQAIQGEKDLRQAIAAGADKDDIEKAQSAIANIKGQRDNEISVYNSLTKNQEAYYQSISKLDDLRTQEATLNAEQRRKVALETAKIEATADIEKNQRIIADEKSTLDERLSALNAIAESKKGIALAEKNNVLNSPGSSTADKIIAERKYSAEITKITEDTNKTLFDQREKFRLKEIQAETEALVQRKQLVADANKELASNENFTIEQRLQFQQNYAIGQKEILDADYNLKKEQVKNTYLTDAERLAIETDYETKVLKLAIDTNTSITNILKAEIDNQQQLREEDADSIRRIYSGTNVNTSSQYAKDVIDLNNSFDQKLISHKKYIEERKKLDQQFQTQNVNNLVSELRQELLVYNGAERALTDAETRLAALRSRLLTATSTADKTKITQQIDVANKDVDVAKKNVDKKISLEKDLNGAIKDLSDDSTNHDIDNQKTRLDNLQTTLSGIGDIASQINDLSGAFSDRAIQQYEDQKTALEDRYQREIELINQTIPAGALRDQKLLEAEKRNQAARTVLDVKERQEKIRKAQADKAAAIFSITINTAKAIVEDLGNPLKIVFDSIVGAAQLAIAIATPLPRFFRGKNDGYEGYGWVDDGANGMGNAPETIVRADGSIEHGGNRPRLTWLGKNDIVLPNSKDIAWQATASIPGMVNSKGQDELKNELKYGFRNTVKAIKAMPGARLIMPDPLSIWMNQKPWRD